MPWYSVNLKKKQSISKDQYEDLVQDWLGTLERFEYIYEENSSVWLGPFDLELTVHATRLDSLEFKHFNKYAQRELGKLIAKSVHEPTITLKEYRPRKKWPTWKAAEELFLYTDYFRKQISVREGIKECGIPIYLLPIEPDKSEWISFWAIHYQQFDGVQLACGALEIPAYKQMAEVNSELSKSGREICQMIEGATGKPTYYYLHRYWGWKNEEKEKGRKCPACGGKWRVTPISRKGIGRFEYKCKPCRLVSEKSSTSEDNLHAEIGWFKGKRPPKPATRKTK